MSTSHRRYDQIAVSAPARREPLVEAGADGPAAVSALNDAGGNQAVVQLLAAGGGDGGAAHEAAAAGVAGAGAPLPHLGSIQQAFGRHDVGGVRAATGGAAGDACQSLGAAAYATGDKVAFRDDAPDLHVAAHEAAHVVQQRHGVALYGGVGRVGDPYEGHADVVADAVVGGRSAEGLLDRGPGAGGGANQAVQRTEEEDGGGVEEIAIAEEIGALDGVQLQTRMRLAGGGYGFLFMVQPNIDALFNDVMADAYEVRCVGDMWDFYSNVRNAVSGQFGNVIRPGQRSGAASGSEGVSELVEAEGLAESEPVQELAGVMSYLQDQPASNGAMVRMTVDDLVALRDELEWFTSELRPQLRAVTRPFLAANQDQMVALPPEEAGPADGFRGASWTTIDELQDQVDEAVEQLQTSFIPPLRQTIDRASAYYVSIQEDHDTFADFLGATLQGGATGPEQLFDGVGRALNLVQRVLDQSPLPDFPFAEFDPLARRCGYMVDAVNSLVAAVEAHAQHRDAQHDLGVAVIDAAALVTSSLLLPYFSAGVGGLAGRALSVGAGIALDATRQQLSTGRVDWGATLTNATLSLLTSGIGNAAGEAIADRLTPMLERTVANHPGLQRLAQEAFGSPERFMAIARDEIAGISGDLISQAVSTTAAALQGGGITWDGLLEETALSLANGVLSRRLEQHAAEERERRAAEQPADAQAEPPGRELAELAPAADGAPAAQPEGDTQAQSPTGPRWQATRDADLLYDMGRITQGDQARVYSAGSEAEAQRLLCDVLASHHDATSPGANYVNLAAALERDGVVRGGLAAQMAVAGDDWQRQVLLDGALDQALRTQLFGDYQAAVTEFERLVAAEPTREFAMVELRTGGFGVVRGELRMVPIDRAVSRVRMHNHPQAADGSTNALTAMPSLTGGDVSVGMEESARSGRPYTQEIRLTLATGPQLVPLVTDAATDTYWFEVPTEFGDYIRVNYEGGGYRVTRGSWSTTAGSEVDVMRWFNSLWGSPPIANHGGAAP